MFDRTHIGWLLSDDYEVAARMRRQRDQADPDQPDPADGQPRRDLLGELLADNLHHDTPPTTPR